MPKVDFYQVINQQIATKRRPDGLTPYQLEVLRDNHRFKTVVWHRRAGKTVLAIVQLLMATQMRIGMYWHVYPFKEEARKSIWLNPDMLFKIIPKQLIKGVNGTLLTVTFTNGSVLSIEGADDPDAFRGQGPKGVVFDEFQHTKFTAWEIASKVLAENLGWAMFIGTPEGKNHFYDFYNRGFSNKYPQWRSWLMRASESGILTTDELQREWDEKTSEEFYNQEYECVWTEGVGQVFKGVNNVLTATEEEPMNGHLYVIGADVAKQQDWTVATVFDRATNKQVHQTRFQKIDYPLQVDTIAGLSAKYNNAIVSLDSTGLGDVFYDMLSLKGTPVTPVKWTAEEKRRMVQKLSMWIQEQDVGLLPYPETVAELEDYTYKRSVTGVYSYGAREGKHDDIVSSIMLAVRELNLIFKPQKPAPELNWLQSYKQRAISNMHGNDEEYFENLAEWERL